MQERYALDQYLHDAHHINSALAEGTTHRLSASLDRLIGDIDACVAANPCPPQRFLRSMVSPHPRRPIDLVTPPGSTLDIPGYVTASTTRHLMRDIADDSIMCEFLTARYAPLPNAAPCSVLARNTRWRVIESLTADESPHGVPTIRLTDEANTARPYPPTPREPTLDDIVEHFGFDLGNNPAHHETLAALCTPWAQNLTREQRMAIALYKGVAHDDINKLCYNPDSVPLASRAEAEHARLHIDAALAAAPVLPHGTTVWRGVWGTDAHALDQPLNWSADAFPLNTTLTLPSYTSTSTDKRVAMNFATTSRRNTGALFVLKPIRGAYTGDAGTEHCPGGQGIRSAEAEILLPRNTQWRVVGHDRHHSPPLVFCIPEVLSSNPSRGPAPGWGNTQPAPTLAL